MFKTIKNSSLKMLGMTALMLAGEQALAHHEHGMASAGNTLFTASVLMAGVVGIALMILVLQHTFFAKKVEG